MEHTKHTHEHNHSAHDHQHDEHHHHSHSHDGEHGHSHSKQAPILYFIGLACFLIALFVGGTLSNILYILSVIISGYHVIFEGFEATYKDTKRLKKFTPNVHVLMALAAFGAIILKDYREAALLIIIFAGAHFLEDMAQTRSRKEITSLLNLNPTQARHIKEDGSIELVDASTLTIGSTVRVLNGDQIPADGEIIEGFSDVNESSITGEAMPVEKSVGDTVFASTINGNGVFTFTVTKDPSDSVFSKILEMVNQSQTNISKTAQLIKRIEPIYVTAVLLIAPLFFVAGWLLLNWGVTESFYRTMVLLTVASPCALAATDIPASLSAISNLARRGVLFKGGAALSNFAEIKAIAFDKTGTLTEGKPSVTDFIVFDEEDKQSIVDVIVAMEKGSNHPLAQAMLDAFDAKHEHTLDTENVLGHGLVATVLGKKVQLGRIDNLKLNSENTERVEALKDQGKTVIGYGTPDSLQAIIGLMDLPNEKSKRMLQYFTKHGVKTTMITGDAKRTGEVIGQQLGITDVLGDVLPEHKAETIKDLQSTYGMVAMVGDGVNDAVALVQADVGIAMGEGTDVAIDVADGVLMQNNLNNLAYTYGLSRKLRSIVIQNIIFAMAIVLILVVMNIFGMMSLPLGVIVHEGSTLIVIFNGLRLLKKIEI